MEEPRQPPSSAKDSQDPSHAEDDGSLTTALAHADDEGHMQAQQPDDSSLGGDQHQPLLTATGAHVTPPFWTRHDRSVSTVSSINQQRPRPILLEDHTEESNVGSQGCWARSATVDDCTIITGPTGIGAYVVWHCTVTTLKGGDMEIRKRYSEFERLRAHLVKTFPHAEAMIPTLPRKSVVSRFRPKFLEQRKAGLAHFLTNILLNPEFAASPVLKDWIFT